MTRENLTALIDRVIGSKGILRAPAWWVRRLFNAVIGYAEDLTNKKPDIYILQAGEYAVDSEIGKELLEIINNPHKYILQSWIDLNDGGEILVGYIASKLDIITDSHLILVSYSRQTSTNTVNGKLVEVGFTEYVGTISKSDDIITVALSNAKQLIPFGKGIDNEMSSTSEYTVSNKVIKAYVDGKVGDIDSILDSINGEEI